jgi:acetyl-CoA carboxylase biotin carboxyl carrier protein
MSETAVNGTGTGTRGHGTDGDGAAGNGAARTRPAVADLVTLLTDRALALSVQAPWAPSSVRIAADAVEVEIRWPTGPAAPAGPTAAGAGAAVPAGAPAAAASLPAAAGQSGAGAGPDGDGPPEAFPLCAGTVGTFYRAPEPGAAPFVTEGDRVRPGQQVGIIEAMKLMIPVEADRPGEVVEFLAADRAPVEYGQPLLLLREAGR